MVIDPRDRIRDRIIRGLWLVVAAFAMPCMAGQVYKCVGPNGEITFTNIKCPDKAQVEHYGTYKRAADQPAMQPDRPQAFQQESVEEGAPSPTAQPLAQEPDVGGYRCRVNGKAWVQPDPCPETSTKYQTVAVDGHDAYTGDPIHGTASVKVTVPVERKAISRSELCDSIAKRERIAERGQDADSGYERRKIAHENCNR